MKLAPTTRTLSVTEATSRGVAGLIKDAEASDGVLLSRHGRPVAAVVSTRQLQHLQHLKDDLQELALVLARAATDTGERGSLDDTITAFGFTREDLEAELAADIAAGRE